MSRETGLPKGYKSRKLTVIRKLGPNTNPQCFPSQKNDTYLVKCDGCGWEILAIGSHLRRGRVTRHERYHCADIDDILKEFDVKL